MKTVSVSRTLFTCVWLATCALVVAGDTPTHLRRADAAVLEPVRTEKVDAKSGPTSMSPTRALTGSDSIASIKLATERQKAVARPAEHSPAEKPTDRADHTQVHARSESPGAPRSAVLKEETGGCGPECDLCWIGTPFENDCPWEWEDDGECDCGCQFPDTSDCFGPTGACCNPQISSNECLLDTLSVACLSAGGAYMGDWSTCIGANCPHRCDHYGLPCEYCYLDTIYESACPTQWQGDGFCDCGCQFTDTVDCLGGVDLPDLVIQSSSRSPATGVVPGGTVTLSDTVGNEGTAAAGTEFWATWFISQDINVTTDDYEWAYHDVACCLQPGQTAGGFGDVPWPNVAPYNTAGQIYYVAVMADDLNEVLELDESNNWGAVWPVVLAGGSTGCPGDGLCCEAHAGTGCQDLSCCEIVCASNSFCCDVAWIQACADLANNLCPELCSGHEACPGQGDCCSPNGTVGCEDATCCNIVCAGDPFCCDTEWDATCAIAAEDLCASCPGYEPDAYEPDNTPVTATVVGCGEVQTHTIPVNGDVDWFAISLDTGDDLTIETFNLAGANPDTVLELYDSGCTLLISDDDGGSELWASRIQWTASYTGVYLIKARTFGGEIDHCDDQGGGLKSCQYDIAFECGFCCDPPLQPGDRVRLSGANPGGAVNLPAGACGTVACCDSDDPALPILVSWDNWTDGHNNTGPCDTTPTPFPDNSGWWMACDQMLLDETCGSCPPPPAPANPTPVDEGTQVPVDVTLCWDGLGQTAKVIYGADDRLDVYEVSDPSLRAVADSTVGLVTRSQLTENPDGSYSLPATPTFAQYMLSETGLPLCASEPFPDQPVPAYCSGFLVGPDLIATAGHCLVNAGECATRAFVFGFDMADASTPVLTYPEDDVYFCAQIVGRVQVGDGPDWGVIRLDRPVVGHTPLPIRRAGTVPTGQSLVMIGHPVGLPTKIAGGATVRDNSPASYFQANVDAYGGNSGSAVFNATTLEVEGVLVRGNADFVESGGCVVSHQCPDSGCPTWESATRVTEFVHLIPEIQTREYEIQFEDCDGMAMAITATTTESCWAPPTLDPGTRYCWQVTAKNACGETPGPVWSFTTVCDTNLTTAMPGYDESLWRSANNIVRLTFDQDINVPNEGELLIRELLDGGLFGPDLSSSFTVTVENDNGGHPRVLKIQENGTALTHRTWYGISSHSWGSVCDFEVHYVVQVGDASNDAQVLAFDVSAINSEIPTFSAADDDRWDINGDGRILAFDVSVTNGSIPSFNVAKPGGH